MTIETKNTIMLALQKISAHYGLQTEAPAGFKKREELLARLKSVNEEAGTVVSDYITAHITADRIENDKEKQTKKPEHWATELQSAKNTIENTDKTLKDFCLTNKIAL